MKNENFEKFTIISRTSVHIICDKKRNDTTTSWQHIDRTFQNWQNNKIDFMKLLFFINETKNEKTHTTMQAMLEKQIKKMQIIWKTAITSCIR